MNDHPIDRAIFDDERFAFARLKDILAGFDVIEIVSTYLFNQLKRVRIKYLLEDLSLKDSAPPVE